METCTAHKLFARLRGKESRPLSAMSIELTRRCNFNCQHCYCVLHPNHPQRIQELSRTQWKSIFDQFSEMGVMDLTITGGEPLLHPEFISIWKAAKNRGFLVTLFTNGSMLDSSLAAFLSEWTPVKVSITLYGASEETYRQVTRRSGMFDTTLKNIKTLHRLGVPLELKGVFSTINWSDFNAVKSLAKEFSETFMWDAQLMGSFAECTNLPLTLRIDPAEYVQKEFSDPDRLPFLRNGNWKPATEAKGALFRCGVGLSSAHIDPYGNMQPCLPLEKLKYCVLEGSVKEGWNQGIPELLGSIPPKPSPCQSCESIEICAFCPGFASLEQVSPEGPIPYKCALADQRAKVFGVADQLSSLPPIVDETHSI